MKSEGQEDKGPGSGTHLTRRLDKREKDGCSYT